MFQGEVKFGLCYVFLLVYIIGLDLGLGLVYAKSFPDDPSRLDLGLDLDSTKAVADGYTFMESGKQIYSTSTVSATPMNDNLNHLSLSEPKNSSVGLGLGLQSSGINELLGAKSRSRPPSLESGSSETDKTTAPEIFRSSSSNQKPATLLSELGLQHLSSRTLTVPSEGGVLQSKKIVGLEINSTPIRSEMLDKNSTNQKEDEINGGQHIQEGLGLSTRPNTREGVSSHVSASTRLGDGNVNVNDSTINGTARIAVGLDTSTFSSVNLKSIIGGVTESKESSQLSNSELPIKEYSSKIAPRKGAEPPKIFPRKGVPEQMADSNSSEQISSKINNGTLSSATSITNASQERKEILNIFNFYNPGTSQNGKIDMVENTTKSITTSPQSIMTTLVNSTDTVKLKTSVTLTNMTSIDGKTMTAGNTSNMLSTFDLTDKSGIIASYPPLKKRLKPQKTTDTDPLESLHVSTEHSSSEHDYVVPIVVIILAVPMLVVLALFLYKRGSECWERRHYRRMDFLIDGMYND